MRANDSSNWPAPNDTCRPGRSTLCYRRTCHLLRSETHCVLRKSRRDSHRHSRRRPVMTVTDPKEPTKCSSSLLRNIQGGTRSAWLLCRTLLEDTPRNKTHPYRIDPPVFHACTGLLSSSWWLSSSSWLSSSPWLSSS
mmetsp:Transcript_17800/g.48019  ORF Transcript_17800/g.48019 Transcript_17800/m.48019 type:complete len:138 (+) Transcript_17800:335-748(+)